MLSGGDFQFCIKLEAIPWRLLHPPAIAMEERRQRHNGSQDGEFKGGMKAEEEKALSDKNA